MELPVQERREKKICWSSCTCRNVFFPLWISVSTVMCLMLNTGTFHRLADAMESSGSLLASLYLCIWDFSALSLQSVRTLHRAASSAPLWFGCSHPCRHLWWPADLLPSWISENQVQIRCGHVVLWTPLALFQSIGLDTVAAPLLQTHSGVFVP